MFLLIAVLRDIQRDLQLNRKQKQSQIKNITFFKSKKQMAYAKTIITTTLIV